MSHLLKYLSDLPRSVKAVFLLVVDSVVLAFSVLLAFAVRFDPASLEKYLLMFSVSILVLMGVQMLVLFISGFYRSVLRHAGPELLGLLLVSFIIGTGIFSLINLMNILLLLIIRSYNIKHIRV